MKRPLTKPKPPKVTLGKAPKRVEPSSPNLSAGLGKLKAPKSPTAKIKGY